MTQAVIFDLDGTLIDSEAVTITAGTEAFARYGHTIGPEVFHRLVGVDQPTGDVLLREMLGTDLPLDRIKADWAQTSRQLYEAHGVPLKTGARELLGMLRARSLPLAVATSSGRRAATWKLESTGLHVLFDTVVTLDCITRPKPAPDPYLEAARRLGIAPARCVAFEDSDTGAASAQAAGMTVVQVPDVVPTDGRHAAHLSPDLISGARAAGLI